MTRESGGDQTNTCHQAKVARIIFLKRVESVDKSLLRSFFEHLQTG